MKKVIIAEKPSLAKNIKNALSKRESFTVFEYKMSRGKPSVAKAIFGKGKVIFYESKSFIITNAFGHLLTIGTMDDYVPEGVNGWSLQALPIYPESFRLIPLEDDGVKTQLELIRYLINRDDVNEIINCGDADREGELIIRNILQYLDCNKYVSRLWLPEQTEEGILFGIDNLKDDREYDNLADEGKARTYMDWLLGFNFSRFLILKTGIKNGTFNAGRVVIPIVEEIYNRELEIRNFKPVPYYQIQGEFIKNGIVVKITDKEKFDKDNKFSADSVCNRLNNSPTVVSDIEKKDVKLSSKKLFSLDKLQGKLAKDNKMEMSVSMKIIQKLYDNGYITYPRTNTEYLAAAEKGKVQELIELFNQKGKNLIFKDTKTVFDDSKIESHSAICPTKKIPSDFSSDSEKVVYETILNRFCSVFAQPCIVERTTATLSCFDHIFKISGDVVKQLGFLEYEPRKKYEDDVSHDTSEDNSSQQLPLLEVGENLNITYSVREKKTQAPPRYTVASLNDFLKCPYKSDLDDTSTDDEEYRLLLLGCEIGTVATRTEIITNAEKKYHYIRLKNNQFYCEPKGEDFINYLKQLKINLFRDRNIDFNCLLKDVFKGKITIADTLIETKKEISKTVLQDIVIEQVGDKYENKSSSIGNCPFCNSEIIEGKNNYYCSNYKTGCTFKIWTTSYCKFSFTKNNEVVEYSKQINLTKTNVKQLLSKKQTIVKNVLEKNGKADYNVAIRFDKEGKNTLTSLGRVFNKK